MSYLTNTSENKNEPYDRQKLKQLGYQLNQQRKARHQADYDLDFVCITENMSSLAIKSGHQKCGKIF